MKEFIRNNAVFIGLSLMLIAALGLALLWMPKGDLHLLLCDRHTPARDIFYRYYTQVAEWFPYVVCVALLLFGRIGDGVFATSALILSALTTQLFKHLINAPRPLTWFEAHMPDVQLPLVEGVRMNYWFSFPSGHTTSFFALFFVLCIIVTNYLASNSASDPTAKRSNSVSDLTAKRSNSVSGLLQTLLFVLATLGAYSRIYLSQHFAADIFAGVVVGVGITICCYVLFYRFEDRKWYNYRLFKKK